MDSLKGIVVKQIIMLKIMIITIACAGRFLTSSSFLAPKYCEIIVEIADLDWPKTQISIDKKDDTIPTAARDSVAFKLICPTMAASVIESMGSEIPAIIAGIANLFIWLLESALLKGYKLNSKISKNKPIK
jgi:hypothetical protein